jgi:hypothetical protein
MPRTLLVLLLLAWPALAGQAPHPASTPPSKAAPKAKRGLTLAQIEQLLSIGSPDDMIAGLVRERGVAGEINRDALAKLRAKGAGPRTLTALSLFLPKATLVITGPAGAEVLLNGTPAGRLDASGAYSTAGLEPGHYAIELRLSRRLPWTMEADLAGRKTASFTATLAPAFGQLLVKLPIPGTRAEVDDQAVDITAGTPLELSVGAHHVRVTAPLRTAFDQTAIVIGDQTVEVDVALPLDQNQLRAARGEAIRAFNAHSYEGALDAASNYLNFVPTDVGMLGIRAMALYDLNRMDHFPSAAQRALAAGATLSLQVQHRHPAQKGARFVNGLIDVNGTPTMRATATAHMADLTITRAQISYSPLNAKCPVKALSQPPSAFTIADSANDVLDLECANPQKAGQTIKLELTDPQGRIPALTELLRSVISGKRTRK